METKAYRLKVTLLGTKPPIWRQLEVRSDTTFRDLHQILQTAMGWTDSHLHEFVAGDTVYGTPDPDYTADTKSEHTVRLDQVLRKVKDRMIYEYDFGDSWEHEIVLEMTEPLAPEVKHYPLVTGGERACPPEDCGGIPGYHHFLEVIENADDPEHEEMLEWAGGEFDPEAFDADTVNRLFHGRQARARSKA